jgi:hypothetical protein
MDTGKDSSVDDLIDISAALERAHRTGERAAQQFTKLLGTLHGGLGVAIAAWLQRVFEQAAGYTALSPLAWHLAVALGFVAVGLISLVLTAIIDQRSSYHFALSTQLNALRLMIAKQRAQIMIMRPGDEKSAAQLSCAEQDAEAVRKIKLADASARRLNTISERAGIGSWVCAIAAFVALAIGVVRTINHFGL